MFTADPKGTGTPRKKEEKIPASYTATGINGAGTIYPETFLFLSFPVPGFCATRPRLGPASCPDPATRLLMTEESRGNPSRRQVDAHVAV